MSIEAGFLAAIHEDPDDDVSRLAFADWLEEQGQSERAEFIRVQFAIDAVTDETIPPELWQLECLLRKQQEDLLLATFGPDVKDRVEILFDRGLPESLRFRDAVPSDYRILSSLPGIRAVSIVDGRLTLEVVQVIARLRHLDELWMTSVVPIFEPAWLDLLLSLPPWTSVKIAGGGPDFVGAWLDFQRRRVEGIGRAPASRIRQTARFLNDLGTGADIRARPPRGRPMSKGIFRGAEDFDLALLGRVSELEDLTLGLRNATARGLWQLARLPRLRSLEIGDTELDSIAPLADCPALERLVVTSEGATLTDAGTAGLERLVTLSELRLRGDGLTLRDETFGRLRPLTRLRTLDLHHGPLEPDTLAVLAGLHRLERLTLVGPLEDDDLRHVAHLTELTYLLLRGGSLTDAALGHLAGLTNLRTLAILEGRSAVTEPAARRLAGQLPEVTIILENLVAKSPRTEVTFRRRVVGGLASALIPEHWCEDRQRNTDTSFWVKEDGWGSIWERHLKPSAIGLIAWNYNTPYSAVERVDSFVALGCLEPPQVVERSVIPLVGHDSASCVFREGTHQSILCSLVGPSFDVFLNCHTDSARFEEFRRLFCFVARSIRVGEEALVGMGEVVTIPITDF